MLIMTSLIGPLRCSEWHLDSFQFGPSKIFDLNCGPLIRKPLVGFFKNGFKRKELEKKKKFKLCSLNKIVKYFVNFERTVILRNCFNKDFSKKINLKESYLINRACQ
jgi:hypothetical protein